MIQPGFAAIGPGGTYDSPNAYGSNNGAQGNGMLDGGMGSDGGGQQQNGLGAHDQGQQPAPPSEYSLAGILHFLQSEWRRYERDRNEWEIERAEMRARVALLEGERRSIENLKTDLMRRVKMLEFALRHERSKYLASSTSAQGTGGGGSIGHGGSTIGGPGGASAVNPKYTALQNQDKASTSSGRSSPLLDHGIASGTEQSNTLMSHRGHSSVNSQTFNTLNMGTLNGSIFGASAAGGTMSSLPANVGASLARQGSSAKDPKARAKSREYLKQCLQEISYLTNTTTLNPLPERAQTNLSLASGHLRPRKTMSDNVPSTFVANAQQGAAGESQSTMTAGVRRQNSLDKANRSAGVAGGARNLLPFGETLEEKEEDDTAFVDQRDALDKQTESGLTEAAAASTDGLALNRDTLNEGPEGALQSETREHSESGSSASAESQGFSEDHGDDGSSRSSTEEDAPRDIADEEDREPITAVYRPGTDGSAPANDDWAKLREAGRIEREKRERERQGDFAAVGESAPIDSSLGRQQPPAASAGAPFKDAAGDDDLASLTLTHPSDDEASRAAAEAVAESQMWKPKRVLRGHLDSVRAVVFDSYDLGLYSASDDGTIKYWKIDTANLKQNKPQTQSTGGDADPVATLRGHSGAVTSLALSTSKRRLYSGSVDASIVVWNLLDSKSVEPYPPFDRASEVGKLVGHTQPVWDLCILPTKGDDEGLLASASADGTVKIWDLQDSAGGSAGGQLLLSFDYYGTDGDAKKEKEGDASSASLPVPTSVSACMSDLRRVAVAYSNAVVKLFDVQSGKEVMQFASDSHYDGTPATQVNKVITHPTLPILITGHENDYIQFFDTNTGKCTLSMKAHLDSVTTLDIDPSGLTLVSGGHDCSVRFWDIIGSNESAAAAASIGAGKGAGGADSSTNDGSANTAVCVQEITAHRKKSAEGVLVVKYHPNATWFCSAGADGVIRIYG